MRIRRRKIWLVVQLGILLLGIFELWTRWTSAQRKPGELKTPYIIPNLQEVGQYRSSSPPDRKNYDYQGPCPDIVMTFALDPKESVAQLHGLIQERLEYARRHEYGIYSQFLTDVRPRDGPEAHFARFVLLREAIQLFPDTKWFWYFDSKAEIRNASRSMSWVLDKSLLGQAMLRNTPISLEQQQIKSYRRNKAEEVDLIFGRSASGLATNAFLVSRNVRARAFIEYALNPLNIHYKAFMEDKDPSSALATHITLWHPQVLLHMAVVPTRMLASTNQQSEVDELYRKGDLAYIAT